MLGIEAKSMVDNEEKAKTFAEKHPKLNLLWGLILLLVFTAAVLFCLYLVANYIGKGITVAFDWLSNIASTLDAVVTVALITGCISLVSVIISSIVSKRIEYKRNRQEYLAKKREEPYGQFVDMIYKMQESIKDKNGYTGEQMQEDISKFSRQITLWGSSTVVNKWVKFRENSQNPEFAQKNLLVLEDTVKTTTSGKP